jgi:maltooligosyltrehalose trehalohydrolase
MVCNLGADTVKVPVTGDVVLAWDEPTADADGTVIAGESFAILRCG